MTLTGYIAFEKKKIQNVENSFTFRYVLGLFGPKME